MKINPLRRSLTTLHISLAILWIYQGLVPKLIFQVNEEHIFWQALGIQDSWIVLMIQLSGIVEIIFGLLFIITSSSKLLHYLNILAMIFFCIVVLILYPHYYVVAFNPFVMNMAMVALSIVALEILSISDKTQTIEKQ